MTAGLRTLALVAASLWLAAPLAAEPAGDAGDAWSERLTFEGDFRLRHEAIREEPGEDRDRERYRGRLGFDAELTDNLEFGLRLATGDGDPVSTNLDFGESVSVSNIRIDRAFLKWSATEELELVAGEMENPFFLAGDTSLMWDGDFNPQGIAGKFESGPFFGRAGGFLLDYRADGVKSRLYAAQAGVRFDVAGSTLSTGVGWFDFTDTANNSPLYGDDAKGNSVDMEGRYVYDYDIAEIFAQYESTVADWPLTIFAEWTRNTRATTADVAYSFGALLGKAEKARTGELSWEWRDTEADALVGTFTDSDLAGGHTDSSGHILTGAYMLTDNLSVGAMLIFSEYGEFQGVPTDFDRVMLDVEFSF